MSAISSTAATVQQQAYVNDTNYQDEWGIYALGNEVFFLGVPDTGHDHSSYFGKAIPNVVALGYDNFDVLISNSTTKATVTGKMANATLYASRSHGSFDANGTYLWINSSQWVHSLDLYNFSTNMPVVDLSGCDIMLFIACNTAKGENSLPQAAVNAGAKHAIGFNANIGCNKANSFLEKFFEQLLAGETVEQAGKNAAEASFLSDQYCYFTSVNE